MKQQDKILLIVVGIIATVFSMFVANAVFSPPKDQSSKVPTADAVETSFPDVKHDPIYNSFLNSNALDPTLPVQIGTSQNKQPFSGQ